MRLNKGEKQESEWIQYPDIMEPLKIIKDFFYFEYSKDDVLLFLGGCQDG